MFDEYPMGGTLANAACEKSDCSPTARKQLEQKKARLTKELSDVDAAIEALDANPEIERVLTLVGRTVRF